MLPLSDRVLLKVSACSKTAREVARALDADVCTVHRILCGLEAAGLVERFRIRRQPLRWRLARGVVVERRNGDAMAVRRMGASRGQEERRSRCRAVTFRGRCCMFPAGPDGLCFRHGTLEGERRPGAPSGLTGEPMGFPDGALPESETLPPMPATREGGP